MTPARSRGRKKTGRPTTKKKAGTPMKKKAGTLKKGPVAELTIPEWMEVFAKLYGDADAKRPPVAMWVAATAHFSTMGETIRRMNFADLMYSAAHAFCWMCSFLLACQRENRSVFALKDSFSAVVASKYPLACGQCGGKPCHCNPQLMDAKANKAARYNDLLKKRRMYAGAFETFTVSQWLSEFNEIYGQQIHMLTLESIGFHFLEEAGEELTAIRGLMQLERVLEAKLVGIDAAFLDQLATFEGVVQLYDTYAAQEPEPHKPDAEAIKARLVHAKVDMFVEFGDTFSWFCSILNKVMSIARNCNDERCRFTQQPFDEKLSEAYLPAGKPYCPSCHKCPCECVFYN